MSETVDILKVLVAFDTTSRRSNLELVAWAADRLESVGARVRLTHDDECRKANLLATFGPCGPGGVVLSGHTDVVPVDDQVWTSDPFYLTERDGRLHGRGTADMKGFVAACLTAASGLASVGLTRPVHIALSYDEEVGCLGVPRLIEDLLEHEALPTLAIVGEPTEMRLGNQHRGFLGFRTRFTGKAAHSSDPSAGASAVYPASALIGLLQAVGDKAGSGVDRTTLNVGRVEGGSAINIVPSSCEVLWEFRPATERDVDALQAMVVTYLARATPDAVRHETELLTRVPPLTSSSDNPALKLARALGGLDPTFAMPFGTEAGFFQAANIPAVICGPGAIAQAHQPDEWIARAQLEAADRFLARLVRLGQPRRGRPRHVRRLRSFSLRGRS